MLNLKNKQIKTHEGQRNVKSTDARSKERNQDEQKEEARVLVAHLVYWLLCSLDWTLTFSASLLTRGRSCSCLSRSLSARPHSCAQGHCFCYSVLFCVNYFLSFGLFPPAYESTPPLIFKNPSLGVPCYSLDPIPFFWSLLEHNPPKSPLVSVHFLLDLLLWEFWNTSPGSPQVGQFSALTLPDPVNISLRYSLLLETGSSPGIRVPSLSSYLTSYFSLAEASCSLSLNKAVPPRLSLRHHTPSHLPARVCCSFCL